MAADDKLAVAFMRKRPDVAARLLETMAVEQAAAVLEASPAEIGAAVMHKMLPTSSARCAEQMPTGSVALLLEQLPVLTGASLLRHLTRPMHEAVLREVSATRAAALKLLLRYPANAVGAWMNPSVLTFSVDYSVSEAAGLLEQADHREPRVYVVDRDRRPCGAVRGLTLLRSALPAELSSIIEPIETIWARESVLAAQRRECWEWQSEAPVVNRLGEFVGSITFAELIKGQRSTARSPSNQSSEQSLVELTELFRHGCDAVWGSLRELAQPASVSPGGLNDDDRI